MITRKELLSSKEYWLVNFQNTLFEQVEKYLEDHDISKSDFAKKLGVSKGYISQIMNGSFDHKVSKLIELSLAIEKAPVLKLENLSEYISADAGKNEDASGKPKRKIGMQSEIERKKSVTGKKPTVKRTSVRSNAKKEEKVSG